MQREIFLSKSACICSLHFRAEYYDEECEDRRKLNAIAVPSLFDDAIRSFENKRHTGIPQHFAAPKPKIHKISPQTFVPYQESFIESDDTDDDLNYATVAIEQPDDLNKHVHQNSPERNNQMMRLIATAEFKEEVNGNDGKKRCPNRGNLN